MTPTIPHNIEAEQCVIGCAMIDAETLHDTAAILSDPEAFFRGNHQIVWRAILDRDAECKSVDPVSLADELARRGELDRIGGGEALADMMGGVPSTANAKYWAGIVREKSDLRTIRHAVEEVREACDSGALTAAELKAMAEERVYAATADHQLAEPKTASYALAESDEAIARRELGEVLGICSGIAELDGMTDGFHPQQMAIIAARPSHGKSALALNIATNAAFELEKRVLFFTLEMPRREMGDRLYCSLGSIEGDKFKSPRFLGRNDRATMQTIRDSDGCARLYFEDAAPLSVVQIASVCRRHKSRHGLDLVIVDYLQLVDGPRMRGENRQEEVARVSRRLKSLSKELNVAVVVTCQINRAAESREDGRPRMADLRESGQIEADAHLILLIHRPEVNEPGKRPGEADIFVAKNRAGPCGVIRLAFQKSFTRFEAIYPAAAPAPNDTF